MTMKTAGNGTLEKEIESFRGMIKKSELRPWTKQLKNKDSWEELSQEKIAEIVSAMEKKVFATSATCTRCNTEWNKVRPSGLCYDCEDYDATEKRKIYNMFKNVGRAAGKSMTFDSFRVVTEEYRKIKEEVLKFDPKKDNLYIYGPCGSGKTHLAIAIMNEWASALKYDVRHVRANVLVKELVGLRGHEELDFLTSLSRYGLLVMDDVGIGRSTEYMLSTMYYILDTRIQDGRKGMVITSNLDLDKIAAKFGDDRLSSRLAGMCKFVECSLPDYRVLGEVKKGKSTEDWWD